MKKLITLTIILLAASSYALASDMSFTLQEAEQYCPLPSKVIFTPNRGSKVIGVLSGVNSQNKAFKSWNINTLSHDAPAPVASSIARRNIATQGEDYGFKSGMNITCYYQEEKQIGGSYIFIMDSAHA
jgi:hypothetical protein